MCKKGRRPPLQHALVGTQEIEPGSKIPCHTHSAPEAEEVLTCLRGTGQILIGAETHCFEPGEPWHVPAGVEHSIVNASKSQSLRLNWTISPGQCRSTRPYVSASLTQDRRRKIAERRARRPSRLRGALRSRAQTLSATALSSLVRDPTTWTIFQQDGSNHLGL